MVLQAVDNDPWVSIINSCVLLINSLSVESFTVSKKPAAHLVEHMQLFLDKHVLCMTCRVPVQLPPVVRT